MVAWKANGAIHKLLLKGTHVYILVIKIIHNSSYGTMLCCNTVDISSQQLIPVSVDKSNGSKQCWIDLEYSQTDF